MLADEKIAMARVFFALWPSTANAQQLASMARTEAAQIGGKATREETIHLTLAFLGDVPETDLPAVIAAATRVRGAAFSLAIDHLGYWAHNRLCWAGCMHPPAALGRLQSDLQSALAQAGFTVDRAHEAFFPHVTLVRKARHPAGDQPLTPALDWACDDFVLVRSRLDAQGSNYECLHRFRPGFD